MNNFWNGKKVLVTGANGFIGRAVVSQLLQTGANVTAAVSPRFDGTIEGVTLVRGDLLDRHTALRMCEGQEAVFHCAALDGGTAFKKTHEQEMLSVNTSMGMNIVDAVTQTGVDRLLVVSSIDVYGAVNRPVIEESDALPEPELPGYARSKRHLERAASEAVRSSGSKIAIARLGNMYGPGDTATKGRVIPTFIDTILREEPIHIINPERELSFLYIDDGARSLLDLAERFATGDPVNIVSTQYTTLGNVVREVGSIIGKDIPVITKESGNMVSRRTFSTKKAEHVINFHEDVSLREGLQRTISWYRDQAS